MNNEQLPALVNKKQEDFGLGKLKDTLEFFSTSKLII